MLMGLLGDTLMRMVTHMSADTAIVDRVIDVLEQVTDTPEVRWNLDIPLFDHGILDSLGMVELILGLTQEFGLQISPAQVEREHWATPRKIARFVEACLTT